MNHFLTLDTIKTEKILQLIDRALKIKQTATFPNLAKYYIANLFFENSTRTKVSFEVAQRKCQMEVIPFETQTSSIQKGETLHDTVKTLEAIGIDSVVIRHTQNAYYETLLTGIDIPIINGGDGTGNHPSQSLLDLMTIKEQFGVFAGLHIAIVGDVAHSRVAHSNINVLQRLGAKVSVATPVFWQEKIADVTYLTIDEAVANADVIMLLRIQHERHNTEYETTDFLKQYGLTAERAKNMKSQSIIMHPAPINRNVEIEDSVVEANNSRIFSQMTNGVYARAAILEYVLQERDE